LAFEDGAFASLFSLENCEVSVLRRGVGGLDSEVERVVLEGGYVSSPAELRRLEHGVYLELARQGVKEASERRDLMVVQAVLSLDDLDRTFNLFSNRLREWYGYHFPELGGIVQESDLYVRLVASVGGREGFTAERLRGLGVGEEASSRLQEAARSSMGAAIRGEDLEEVMGFAAAILQMYRSRKTLEDYLERVMKEVAPNTLALAGPTLGARLISATGSVENLAKRSASTIQVLGAEKALFRSLRAGSRPPKHGLIFQHKDVHQAPRWQRGKVARALAGKLAIAARLDAYGGGYRGGELLEEFQRRLKEIQERYPQPPRRGRKRDGED
jgi:nucleolar protein 56